MNYDIQRVLALILFVVFLPVFALVALACLIWHGRPVFYSGVRLGQGRNHFSIWKFRTMDGECVEPPYVQSDLWRVHDKDPNDFRITPFGRFLRRFSIDEFPQLWNVMSGDMALVGPRPIVDAEDLLYGVHGDVCHSVKPGMTGLWQVSGRNLTTYHRRVALDRYYVLHRSFALDIWILWRTVGAVISGRGAY
ncbi:MAG: sugar transferase [Victivallaceae bacterium]|nr:sugar transferase [Victivallaceae bacterium]